MSRRSFIKPLLLLWLCPLFVSFQWPLDEIVLMKTFAEPKEKNFNTGLLFGGPVQDVHAIEGGAPVFIHEEGDLSGIPSGLGNFVVLEHERGLVSLYAHLDELSLDDQPAYVEEGFILGTTGTSGDAPGNQLFLEVVDKEFNRMVNPLLLLPPRRDTLPPVIESVEVYRDQSFLLGSTDVLPAGEGRVFITLYDPSQSYPFFRPMAPFRISLFANGEELFFQSFEAIEARKGTLYLVSQKGQRSFSDLYAGPYRYYAGSFLFNPGETRIELIVSDYTGNTAKANFSVKVQ